MTTAVIVSVVIVAVLISGCSVVVLRRRNRSRG